MAINKYKMVGSVLLAFGLWGNNIYGSVDANGIDAFDAFQPPSREEELREELRHAVSCAGQTPGRLTYELARAAKLIRLGADFTSKNKEGETLLFDASCPEVLVVLLCLPGIDIDAQNNEGDTALHADVSAYLYFLPDAFFAREEIRLLIKCKANPFLKNEEGKTPRQLLEEWKRKKEVLPLKKRPPNSGEALADVSKTIQILRDAERKWAAAHSEWMAAHPECVVE
ncbi:MAG: hypothetical protein LBB05_03030 [Puniceicoccales bacterium]|nr:hypothetical protein [Puniceicoccales bacterium]